MADINGVSLAAGSSPKVTYTITYTKSRPNNSQMTYNFTISAALGSSSSYIGSGLALNCTMTVNGSSAQVRIKANDNDNWSGTTPRVKTVSVTCASTTGNAAQAVRFQVVSDGRATLTSGVIDNSSYTVTSSALLYTACGAPTSLSVNSTLSEGAVTLSWSGAASGTNNAISSYEIQYSDSSNNSSWGSWYALTTITTTAASSSTSVNPPGTRGYYRRFQIRTRGVAGASYYSGWKVSTNSVRMNTLPKAPTAFSASPTSYSSGNITLTWSGAAAGLSSIKQYTIQYSTSTNGSTWGSWTALTTVSSSAISGSTTVTPPTYTIGTYTRFRICSVDTLNAASDYTTSNSILCQFTKAIAPTSVSLSATLSEGNVALSWSGAAPGSGGPISGFPIQYSDSSNNSTWGAWTDLYYYSTGSGNGSYSVAPPPTRGYYRRFRVRTEPTTGTAYSSDWVISSNTIRRNMLPTAPTAFTVSPTTYQSGAVTLQWGGAATGTSAIKNYVIQISTSTDGNTWSGYSALATVTTSATSGSYSYTPGTMAAFTRYRICATDTLDCISAYTTSNTIRKNSPPPTPTITAPKAGSTTYNTQPRILITLGAEPDGDRQMLCVRTTSGVWQDSVNNPSVFSRSGWLGDNVAVKYRHAVMQAGGNSISVKAKDDGIQAESAEAARTFTVAASPFADVVPNETPVKASHISALRTAVNNVRNYYSLAAYAWSEDMVSGKTQIRNWSSHIVELRKAVGEIVDVINKYDSVSVFDVPAFEWIPLQPGRPSAAVMEQLHNLILSL